MPLQLAQQSEMQMTDSSPRFGFVAFAETWNGRLAMLGFVIGLGTELLTGQGILSQIGLG
jgi:ferrochelatase